MVIKALEENCWQGGDPPVFRAKSHQTYEIDADNGWLSLLHSCHGVWSQSSKVSHLHGHDGRINTVWFLKPDDSNLQMRLTTLKICPFTLALHVDSRGVRYQSLLLPQIAVEMEAATLGETNSWGINRKLRLILQLDSKELDGLSSGDSILRMMSRGFRATRNYQRSHAQALKSQRLKTVGS